MFNNYKKFLRNREGVFGLDSVRTFFIIMLAIGLLAFVIVTIMGTLSNTNVLPYSTSTVSNETGGFINQSGYTLAKSTVGGFNSPTVLTATNSSSGVLIGSGNYSVSNTGVVTNLTASGGQFNQVNFTYSYSYYSTAQVNTNGILTNTSTGIVGFFTSVNPVYAILAVLVIILILVVLVRVVSGGTSGFEGRESSGVL